LRATRAASVASRSEPPFKFSHHRAENENANDSISGVDPDGAVDFTSNIPVIVLRSQWPGPVSKTKSYSAFTMEIYEPGTNAPARFAGTPTVTTRVGLRLHGMVSRLFPKLSYRLKLQDENDAESRKVIAGDAC
jgi:hypothetical protein